MDSFAISYMSKWRFFVLFTKDSFKLYMSWEFSSWSLLFFLCTIS